MKKLLLLSLFLSLFLQAKPTVSVSILPQKYFVEQISKDILDINVMVPKGASPAVYEPKPRQMSKLEKSSIYFAIGVPYERVWIGKFKEIFPNLNIVKTQNNIQKVALKSHSHKDHEHKILDPHIWLDPILVKIQAKNIASALIKHFPSHKDEFNANLKAFLTKLDRVDGEIKKLLKDKKGAKFLVYHPTWGYFASRYGLVQITIEIEGKEPKPKELANIINQAKKEHIKVIFAQPQFSQKSAKTIAQAVDAEVVSIDHLSPDWESELLLNIKKISRAFK